MNETPRHPHCVILTTLRRNRGWSEEKLATADGISVKMLSLYESGARIPSREKLDQLAGHMEYTPAYVSFLLFSLSLAELLEEGPRSPVDPSPEERLRIREVAIQVGLADMALTEVQSLKMLRARRARRDRHRAAAVCRRLLAPGVSPAQRRLSIENAEECQRWAVAECLAHESEKTAAHSAADALELARLAMLAAELSPGEDAWRFRILGYVWIFFANAIRVGGKLQESDEAFAKARQLWEAGAAADPGLLARWRLPDREASLRRHQERYSEALALHAEALKLAPKEAAGRILLNKAGTLVEMGDAERALATLLEAEPLIDEKCDPRHLFGLQFNRIVCLCRLERYKEGEDLLPKVRERAVALGSVLDLERSLWLQGRLAAGLGRVEEAISSLEQVRRTFDHKIPYDFAEVSLELAAIYRGQGRIKEVKALAGQLVWIFTEQGVHGEAKKALRLFCEAAEEERLTVELIRRLLDYLVRARHNPRLRFEP
ncbi:MAG TPA: helix-turn-helix domain-containing protein [Thermoanaerobaculia bacterium]|jgi:tetratricopeptide (TPR) repeat protein|nr:helix-turn-helix domain-containing protein [Thermoanaerobaculia bacterium]